MSNVKTGDIAHPIDGILHGDMDWDERRDDDAKLQYLYHTHHCGCKAVILGSADRGWRVSIHKTCFVREGRGAAVGERTIQWYDSYGRYYPECNEIYHAQELARLLLSVWDKELVEEYLLDLEERDRLVMAIAEDCGKLVEHVRKTLKPWRKIVPEEWFDGQMEYLHLSPEYYDPGALEDEVAIKITEGYSKKWCDRIRSEVLPSMDSEFGSRGKQWRRQEDN